MTEAIANVATTDTFSTWLTRTNLAITALRTTVLSTGNTLVGNVSMVGTFNTTDLVSNTVSSSAMYVSNNVVWHAGNQGALSGLDADKLDGQHGAYYLNATNFTGNLPNGRISGTYTGFANIVASGTISGANIIGTNLAGNGASVTSVDAVTVGGFPASYFANTTHVHALSDITGTANVAIYTSGGILNKDFRYGTLPLTDGATITLDANTNANIYTVTLAGNRTMGAPTNLASSIGKEVVIYVTQDGTGSRTLAWNSAWKFPGGTAPTLTTSANAVDMVVGIVASASIVRCSYIITDIK